MTFLPRSRSIPQRCCSPPSRGLGSFSAPFAFKSYSKLMRIALPAQRFVVDTMTHAMQYNAIQYHARHVTQCHAIQCNAMQCDAMQYNMTIRLKLVRLGLANSSTDWATGRSNTTPIESDCIPHCIAFHGIALHIARHCIPVHCVACFIVSISVILFRLVLY